jgi:N-acetyl-1-D-myo-inositol-2-amino-2-deoxy-alpha-D-glucopyranoside deacetylase
MNSKPNLLFVHAHPDDETIVTGATMAKYAAEGCEVTLITCTAGEEGEVLVPDLAHLAAGQNDELGPERKVELANAMAELGVTDFEFLGGFGTYRDSGMIGTEPNTNPKSFWQADLLDAANHVVKVIRDRRPQVLVTYDEFGGYGHPDHIQAHRVAMYAAALAAAPSYLPEIPIWSIPKIYWIASPRERARAQFAQLMEMGIDIGMDLDEISAMPYFCDDELVTTAIDGSAHADKKAAALRAHKTQIDMESGFLAAIGQLGNQATGLEHFRLVGGSKFQHLSTLSETDLLAGL